MRPRVALPTCEESWQIVVDTASLIIVNNTPGALAFTVRVVDYYGTDSGKKQIQVYVSAAT